MFKENLLNSDPFDDEIEITTVMRITGMRKMSKEQEKKFPSVVADSIKCQTYHIARCMRCTGCGCAIAGCEKIFEMSAG